MIFQLKRIVFYLFIRSTAVTMSFSMSNTYVALSTKALEPNRLTLAYRGMSSKETSFSTS